MNKRTKDGRFKCMTLCIPLIANGHSYDVILGEKLKGFGAGKWNGFGGHVEEGETIEEAAVRELKEEAWMDAEVEDLTKVAELEFTFPSSEEDNQLVYIFTVEEWSGTPMDSDEMRWSMFHMSKIPYRKMWPDDQVWLPFVLSGRKVKGSFRFAENGENIECVALEVVKEL